MLQEVDQNLDLVMIMDKWFESMIFLKEALNLSYEDVMTFNINRVKLRTEPKNIWEYNFSGNYDSLEKYQATAVSHIKGDAALYHYFSKKLEDKIENYGVEKMAKEVAILKNLTATYEKLCSFDQDNLSEHVKDRMNRGDYQIELSTYFGWVPEGVTPIDFWPNPKLFFSKWSWDKKNYRFCKLRMLPELKFGEMLKYKQNMLRASQYSYQWYVSYIREGWQSDLQYYEEKKQSG